MNYIKRLLPSPENIRFGTFTRVDDSTRTFTESERPPFFSVDRIVQVLDGPYSATFNNEDIEVVFVQYTIGQLLLADIWIGIPAVCSIQKPAT